MQLYSFQGPCSNSGGAVAELEPRRLSINGPDGLLPDALGPEPSRIGRGAKGPEGVEDALLYIYIYNMAPEE